MFVCLSVCLSVCLFVCLFVMLRLFSTDIWVCHLYTVGTQISRRMPLSIFRDEKSKCPAATDRKPDTGRKTQPEIEGFRRFFGKLNVLSMRYRLQILNVDGAYEGACLLKIWRKSRCTKLVNYTLKWPKIGNLGLFFKYSWVSRERSY